MSFWNVLKTTVKEWQEDQASRYAAALAYYTVFALAPLLIIAIGVAGFILGQDAAQREVIAQITAWVGPQVAEFVENLIAQSYLRSTSVIATVVGTVTLLFGASSVFGELQVALNRVWNVEPEVTSGVRESVRHLVLQRMRSLALVLGFGLLLIASVSATVALARLSARLLGDETSAALGQTISLLVQFAIATLLFAAMFKILPDLDIQWRDVWLGAMVTALLFTIGQFFIGLFLALSATASAFGAASSLVVLLIWIYYSLQILLLGAEFTQVWARARGTRTDGRHLLDDEQRHAASAG